MNVKLARSTASRDTPRRRVWKMSNHQGRVAHRAQSRLPFFCEPQDLYFNNASNTICSPCLLICASLLQICHFHFTFPLTGHGHQAGVIPPPTITRAERTTMLPE